MHAPSDDFNLLDEYTRLGSVQSLDELVRRNLPMVHAAALRQTGDCYLAEDVSQAVFVQLMRSARRISRRATISGWLYNTTRFLAARARRGQSRRARHEKEAGLLKTSSTAPSDNQTPEIQVSELLGPLLDHAIASLSSADRDAVVMRFLQGKTHRQIADAQQISEDAARQRVFRALQRLRKNLQGRGLALSDDSLNASLAAIALRPPPTSLAKTIASTLRMPSAVGRASGLAYTIARYFFMLKTKHMAIAIVTVLLLGGIWVSHALLAQANAPSVNRHDGPGSTPLATMFNVLDTMNNGNADALVRCFDGLSPATEKEVRTIAHGVGVANRLKEAIAARLGDAQATKLAGSLGLLPPLSYGILQQAKTTINGNTAQLQIARIGAVPFKKVGNTWLLVSQTAAMLPSNFVHLDPFLADIEQMIVNVKAGKYPTAHDLQIQLNRLGAKIQNADTSHMDLPARPDVLAPAVTPQETIAAVYWASQLGDETATLACVNTPNEVQKGQLQHHAEFGQVYHRFLQAITDNFGQYPAKQAALTLGMETGLTGSLLKKAPVTDNGDRAQIDLRPSAMGQLNLLRVDGVWKVDPSFLPPPNPGWFARCKEHYFPQYNQIALDLDAGKYETFAQLQPVIKRLHEEYKSDYAKYFPTTTPAPEK